VGRPYSGESNDGLKNRGIGNKCLWDADADNVAQASLEFFQCELAYLRYCRIMFDLCVKDTIWV